MNSLSFTFVALTLAVAIADWAAVAVGNRRAEFVAKPLTMVMLAGVVLTLDSPANDRWSYLVAVLLSLAGDVFLMLPGERESNFLAGLVSFLLAHVAYVVSMVALGVSLPLLLVGVALAAAAMAVIGTKIAFAAKKLDKRLFPPVVAYMIVIAAMVSTAIATGIPIAIVGALLFFASDSVLGWNRFVRPIPHAPLIIMVTYHLGQLGLVLGMASGVSN